VGYLYRMAVKMKRSHLFGLACWQTLNHPSPYAQKLMFHYRDFHLGTYPFVMSISNICFHFGILQSSSGNFIYILGEENYASYEHPL
jgi:hypothetical protein